MKKQGHNDEIIPNIREATINDIDEVIDVSRKCFPMSLQVNAIRCIARIYWEFLIKSNSIDVYVITTHKNIAGIYVVITNLDSYNKEIQVIKFKILPYLELISGILRRPALIKYLIIKIINRIRFYFLEQHETFPASPQKIDIDKIAWEHFLGISPKYRGKGLAKHFQRLIIDRCVTLGKEYIMGKVEPTNREAISLHELSGYIKTNQSSTGFTFTKKINKL